MSGLATLRACEQGHVIYYPAALHDKATGDGHELAFCSMCECGTVHFAVVWSDGHVRIMASGNGDLYARFEAQRWPEVAHADGYGPFTYRVVDDPLAIRLFLNKAPRP
jgi:hypothetical protein